MSLLRILFDNLGIKLVALLLAFGVYLHVYTERPATMMVAFPLEVTDLPDSLAIWGPVPATVQAELRGTGKQLIRLRLTEPRIKVSLAGVGAGHFQRRLTVDDLPLMPSDRLDVQRLAGPLMLELEVQRKLERRVPVAVRITGVPPAGFARRGAALVDPSHVLVRGPARALAGLDSVVLQAVRVDGQRDTVRAIASARTLPERCEMEPATVNVIVPVGPGRGGK